MANVRSRHYGPLGLPGGPSIPAGCTVSVPNWDRIKDNDIVKGWLAAGAIEVEGSPAEANATSGRRKAKKGDQSTADEPALPESE